LSWAEVRIGFVIQNSPYTQYNWLTWLLAGIVVEVVLGLLQKQMLDELVAQLVARTHLAGVQVGGGGQDARGARINVLVEGLRRLLLPLPRILICVGTDRAIQGGRDADVQHAAAQDEKGSMEATVLRQVFYQNGQNEATSCGARHANAVGQGTVLIKVLGHYHYARRRGESSANSYGR